MICRWIHPKQEERKVHKGRLTSHSTDPAGVAKGFSFFKKKEIYIFITFREWHHLYTLYQNAFLANSCKKIVHY